MCSAAITTMDAMSNLPYEFIVMLKFSLTDGLSSSGGTGETPSQLSPHFWQNARRARAAKPPSDGDGVGRLLYRQPLKHGTP